MLATFALVICASAPMTDWYVDDDAVGPGTGTLSDPYPTIQAAVDAATTLSGDTVLVLDGLYPESLLIDTKVVNVQAAPGAGSVVLQRTADDETALTIRSIGAPGVTIRGLEISGPSGFASGIGRGVEIQASEVRLSSCRVTGQRNDGFQPAGIRIDGGDVRITDCMIDRNDGGQFAGGLGVFGDARVTIESTTFDRNPEAIFSFSGGAVYFAGSELTVSDCLFTRNNGSTGSGVHVAAGTALFQGSRFLDNGDGFNNTAGGALFGAGTVERCLFRGNSAQSGGAVHGAWVIRGSLFEENRGSLDGDRGVAVDGQMATEMFDCVIRNHFGGNDFPDDPCSAVVGATLVRCTLEGNTTARGSGFANETSGGAITNCVATECRFIGNEARSGAPGVAPSRGGAALDSVLVRCELVGNSAGAGSAAYGCALEQCTIVGNITKGVGAGGAINESDLNSCIVFHNEGAPLTNSMATYSCVEGGAPGVGNISTDPLFWGPQSGDLRPMAGSPCIDSGDPALGDPVTGPADMGALPVDAGYQGVPGGFCPSGADGSGCTPSLQAAAHPTLASDLQVAATNMGATSLSVIFLGFETGAMPYVNGTLCLGGPLARGPLGVLSTPGAGCGHDYSYSVPGTRLASAGFGPGDRLYGQVLYRDTVGGVATVGITGALEAIVQP